MSLFLILFKSDLLIKSLFILRIGKKAKGKQQNSKRKLLKILILGTQKH